MSTIHSAMLVMLGFLAAGLVGLLLAPVYRRRAARLATDELKRTVPLTLAEIRADKDRVRADYALKVHRLQMKVEAATHASAKQMVEINRRDAGISALEGEVERLRGSLEEHENARRVLEQTIMDRLPKVEFRLTEAKRLLLQRDREIAALTNSATRQQQALEEATQINAQQRDEVHRLNAALTTRAARNREQVSDPRFDGELALRSEIEALRSKAREQSGMISRLQEMLTRGGSAGNPEAARALKAADDLAGAAAGTEAELSRLRKDLTEAEIGLRSARGIAEAGSVQQATLESEMRVVKSANEDLKTEISKLKAALKTYESEDVDDRAVKESKIAMQARLSALTAEGDEQTATIQRLRAEIAATNEKLARQAAHFMDEMRKLGLGAAPTGGRRAAGERSRKPSLVDRISAPRPANAAPDRAEEAAVEAHAESRSGNGNGLKLTVPGTTAVEDSEPADASVSEPAPAAKARRGGLLERITRLEKPASSKSAAE